VCCARYPTEAAIGALTLIISMLLFQSAKVFVQTVVQQYKPKRQFKRFACCACLFELAGSMLNMLWVVVRVRITAKPTR